MWLVKPGKPPTRWETSVFAVPSIVSGTELGRRADRVEQRLDHAVAGCVHAQPAAEVHADRGGAVSVNDRAQPVPDVVEAGLPGRRLQPSVQPHQRPLDAVLVVVDLGQGPSLGAGVPLGEGVLLVAAHADNLVAHDVDHDPADRRADPAEAADGLRLGLTHRACSSSLARADRPSDEC